MSTVFHPPLGRGKATVPDGILAIDDIDVHHRQALHPALRRAVTPEGPSCFQAQLS
jgi:hypothetical protein